jgi:hypothetical protein
LLSGEKRRDGCEIQWERRGKVWGVLHWGNGLRARKCGMRRMRRRGWVKVRVGIVIGGRNAEAFR